MFVAHKLRCLNSLIRIAKGKESQCAMAEKKMCLSFSAPLLVNIALDIITR